MTFHAKDPPRNQMIAGMIDQMRESWRRLQPFGSFSLRQFVFFSLRQLGWRRRGFLTVNLDVGQAVAMARLHGTGGFSRGWDPNECAALLIDRTIVADGILAGPDDPLHGFIVSRLAGDEAEVLSIVVAPDCRGRGHGATLLQINTDRLMRLGVARVFLEVAAGNRAAIALYARAGFTQVGRREGYYPMADGSKAAALVMRRDLA